MTGDRVFYRAISEVKNGFPQITNADFDRSPQFIERDSRIYHGAEGIARLLFYADKKRWVLWVYTYIPFAALLSEILFKSVSSCRPCAMRFMRWFQKKL